MEKRYFEKLDPRVFSGETAPITLEDAVALVTRKSYRPISEQREFAHDRHLLFALDKDSDARGRPAQNFIVGVTGAGLLAEISPWAQAHMRHLEHTGRAKLNPTWVKYTREAILVKYPQLQQFDGTDESFEFLKRLVGKKLHVPKLKHGFEENPDNIDRLEQAARDSINNYIADVAMMKAAADMRVLNEQSMRPHDACIEKSALAINVAHGIVHAARSDRALINHSISRN